MSEDHLLDYRILTEDNCWNCRTSQQKFRCKGCGFALYCSQICQKEHWKSLHGPHCKYLSGKKVLHGSAHSPDTCGSCQNESADYDQLDRKDSPGMACHIRLCDSDLTIFKKYFIVTGKYNMRIEKAEIEKSTWGNINFPFEFGEITGNYFDYLDKLLGFLQSLLCHLKFLYPKIKKIVKLSIMLSHFRAVHWFSSLKTGVTSQRVGITLGFIRYIFAPDWVLELHEILGKLESQNHGVSAWNSFIFLYEMLGASSLILPLLSIDKDSFDEEDEQCVSYSKVITRTIKNKEHRIFIHPLLDQISSFKEQLESLTICDANFNLKPFQKIYEHFAASSFEVPEIKSKNLQQSSKSDPYFCELCLKDVDRNNCEYVFHSMELFDKSLMRRPNRPERTWEEERLICASKIVADKPYITFSMGSGLRLVCNEGECKDIFVEHVAVYRITLCSGLSSIISKYELKFGDLQCCVCKILCGKSHRCSTCKSRLYCSQECQNEDWNIHKVICNDLKESGTQVKIDSKERKERGDIRAEKALTSALEGCKCGEKDCAMVNDMKRLLGRKKTHDKKVTEEEVD